MSGGRWKGITLEERFWAKVDKRGPDECWPWTAATYGCGYGLIRIGGKNQVASRVVWLLLRGGIPDGMHVLHRCDNPACVNPEHLFLGTHLENMRDMYSKGRRRHPAGARNGRAKLDEQKAAYARAQMSAGRTIASVATELGVSQSTIQAIRAGRLWRSAEAA